MGQKESIQYAFKTSEEKPNETPIFRNPSSKAELHYRPEPGMNTLQDVFLNSVKKFGTKNMFASKNSSNQYEFTSYQHCFQSAKQTGSGMINMDLLNSSEDNNFPPMKFYGVYAKNREEWITLDVAAVLYEFTCVPLYDTLGLETISYVLNETKLRTLFCSIEKLDTLKKVTNFGNLMNLVFFEENIPEDAHDYFKNFGIKLLTFSDVKKAGNENINEPTKINGHAMFTFCYTSGTTGDPKGAIFSHNNMMSLLAAIEHSQLEIFPSDIHLSYLPLPHVYERCVFWACIYAGALVYFYSGDILKIKDDLAAVKPTVFFSVPRLFNRFHDVIRAKLNELTGFKKSMVEHAIKVKLENLNKNAEYTHGLWDKLVFNKIKDVFGGRVRLMLTASAPISKEVLDFLKISACCPILECYGQTENTGAGFMTNPKDHISGHVGGIVASLEFKLVDVPDLNYTVLDKDEKGNPQPRGEICLRGPSVIKGYYKKEDKTNEAIDQDGWLHTGDVGLLLTNYSLKIIDRKKNIFKLSIGEYIAPEKIENVYMRAKGVLEIFVHGESLQSYLLAFVFPDQNYILRLAGEKGIAGEFKELCENSEIVKKILENLNEEGKKNNLLGFEQAKKLHLVSESFAEYGLLTNSLKLKRNEARNYFKAVSEKLYQD